MLKKIFHNPTKRKRQEVKQRHNTSKVTMDPVSTAILSRHFSPLSCKAMSPSDLIDIVGYPAPANNIKSFSQSSPELTTPSLQLSKNILQQDLDQEEHEEVQQVGRVRPKQLQGRQQPRQQRLTIRNNTTPPPPLLDTETTKRNDILLLETSREDKTLVEEDQVAAQAEKSLLDKKTAKEQVVRLHQKLLGFQQERNVWKQKIQGYIEREEEMRRIIYQSQLQINQLKNLFASNGGVPSRHNSYKTVPTNLSSSYHTEEEEDEPEEEIELEEGEELEEEADYTERRIILNDGDAYYNSPMSYYHDDSSNSRYIYSQQQAQQHYPRYNTNSSKLKRRCSASSTTLNYYNTPITPSSSTYYHPNTRTYSLYNPHYSHHARNHYQPHYPPLSQQSYYYYD